MMFLKNKKTLFLLFIVVLSSNLYSIELSKRQRKAFLDSHCLDPEDLDRFQDFFRENEITVEDIKEERLKEKLEEAGCNILSEWYEKKGSKCLTHKGITNRGNIVVEHPDLDGVVLKFYARKDAEKQDRLVRRAEYSSRIGKFILKNGLWDLVKVPKKFLIHIPGAGDELVNENYCVVAPKIDLFSMEKLYRVFFYSGYVNSLLNVIRGTEYGDAKEDNIFYHRESDSFVIIDTEDLTNEFTGDVDLVESEYFKEEILEGRLGGALVEQAEEAAKKIKYGWLFMLSDRCDVAEIGLEIIRKVLTLQRGVRLFRKRCFPNDNQKNVFDRHERELEEEITSLIMVGNELRCNRHIPDEEYKPRKRRRKR